MGDALGSPHEGAAPPINPGALGHLTDDTQLTLATCEAITQSQGHVLPQSIADSFLRWFASRRLTGLGASTLTALKGLEAGGHWALVGRRGERAAGNGAAMRIAPLAFLLDPHQSTHRRVIRDVCRITHHNDEAYAGALAIVVGLRLALNDDLGHPNFLRMVALELPDSNTRDALIALADNPPHTLEEMSRKTGVGGYVAQSVPLALGAANYVLEEFESRLKEVVSLGGDCDTIASMTAQLAAAQGGLQLLPRAWLTQLPRSIEPAINAFCACVCS